MAAPVLPPARDRGLPGISAPTTDERFWKTFKNQLLLASPHNAAITSVTTTDYNPNGAQADSFAVTSGGRVQLYSSKTRKVLKNISRFGVDDTARSGALRRDGRILLAGGDSGVVQAFDTGSRAILRQWRGEKAHRLPVHTVRWNPCVLTDLMSCSDDRTVRIWDLTEDEAKWTGIGHEDYVRCGCYLPGQASMPVSGSYDQTVRLWDTRQQHSVMTFKHNAPIEALMALNKNALASAAGNEVFVLNLVGGKVEHIVQGHQRTVTSLSSAQKGTRLLTAGLDAHVKVHNTSSWEEVAQKRYDAPILSMSTVGAASSQNDRGDRHLVVGLQTGLLSIQTRLAGAEKVKAKEKEKKMQALMAGEADAYERKQKKKDMRQGIRARDRGKDYGGEEADLIIAGNDRARQQKLRPWQKHLREGRYGLALDHVLQPEGGREAFNNSHVLTLIKSLLHRGSALRHALANRNEGELLPILHWCLRYVGHPRHVGMVYEVLLPLLDLYSPKIPEWDDGDEGGKEVVRLMVGKLGKRVGAAVDEAQRAVSMQGMVQMLEFG